MNLTRPAKPASERTSFDRINDASLAGLDADQGVGRLAVVAAFIEAVALRAVEDGDAQARVQVLALFAEWYVGLEKGKQVRRRDMQARFRHLGARSCTQAIAAHQGGGKLGKVGNRGIHRARRAHLAALFMGLRLAPIVPPIGHIGFGLPVMKNQACARHPQPIEIGLRQIANIQPQPLRLAAVLDHELQQDETLPRIAEVRAGLKMNVQFVVGFDEPEVAEAGRMRQAHTRRNLLPARIVRQVLIRPVLVRENRIGPIARQRLVQIVFDRRVQVQFALVDNCITV